MNLVPTTLLLFLLACGFPGKQEPAAPGQLLKKSLKIDGTSRTYELYVPKRYDGKSALPLVIMLHGGGGTGKGTRETTRWDHKAEKEGFLAAFPNATRPDPDSPPKFGKNSPIWNDGSGRLHAGENGAPDVRFLEALIDQVSRSYQVDARRIYMTGFSNGASMTFRAGMELSDRLAAVAPVAGAFWIADPEIKSPLPLLYVTGTADTMNPLEGGMPKFARGKRGIGGKKKPPVIDSVRKWARAIGCDGKPSDEAEKNGVRKSRWGGGRNGSEVLFYRVEGMGHYWPGGDSELSAWMVGRDPGKLNGTDLAWEFFQSHPKK